MSVTQPCRVEVVDERTGTILGVRLRPARWSSDQIPETCPLEIAPLLSRSQADTLRRRARAYGWNAKVRTLKPLRKVQHLLSDLL